MAIVLLLIVGFLVSALKAGVLSVLWFWFLTPLGVPGIGLAQAWGISLLITLFTYDPSIKREGSTDNLIAHVVLAGFALLIGFILKGFM